MKLVLTTIAAALGIFLNAQSESADAASQLQGNQRSDNPTTQALWDIEFSYNITTTSSSVGCAGICFVNNEFWISKWASDTFLRYNAAGVFLYKFTIPGLTGTRSLTTDGTYIYASTNSTTIFRIDPILSVLAPPHIAVAPPIPVRWSTYDPTLNSNAGGFWIGNFSTDIYSIDMTGAQLSAIPAATHGLTAMYGAAVDLYTAGGPYLWISNQGGPNSNDLVALSLVTGNVITTHNVFPDFAATHSLTSSLGGGAFLTNQLVPGEVTLMTCMQGTPYNVFAGYEVQQPIAPIATNDIELITLVPLLGHTMLPSTHTFPETHAVKYVNNSLAAVDSFEIHFSVINGANTTVYAETLHVYNTGAGAVGSVVTMPYQFGGTDNYTIRAISQNAPPQIDSVLANDTATFFVAVNDSAFAYDMNTPDLITTAGIPNMDWGYVVSTYTMQVPDLIGGIWIRCTNPVVGDSVAAVIFDASTGAPTNLHAQGPVVFLGNTNWQFIPFINGIPVQAQAYAFGFYDPANQLFGLSMEYTPEYDISPDYIYSPTTGWQYYGVNENWFIRPLLESAMLHVADSTGPAISVYPNPAADEVTIYVGNDQTKTFVITDMNGKVVRAVTSASQNTAIDISDLAKGTYVIQVSTEGNSWSQQIVKSE